MLYHSSGISQKRLETPIIFTNRETAELIKYAANSFLATKITFINEISNLCEKVGANVNDVSIGIGLDGRIGKKFLHPGPGYGGSCFPKDTLALVKTAKDHRSPLSLIENVVESNNQRKKSMHKRILNSIGKSKKKVIVYRTVRSGRGSSNRNVYYVRT